VDNDGDRVVIGVGEGGTTPTVEMVNVLLADNGTQGWPIVANNTGSARLMNVTLAGNATGDDIITWAGSAMTLTNTILWSNTTSAENMIAGSLSVSYSDIEGAWEGTDNIDADPRFVDAANGDYHLKVGSPCIDKGTPRDATPDMGAYEWTGFRIFLSLVLRSFGP
jgi:hypothetical protein